MANQKTVMGACLCREMSQIGSEQATTSRQATVATTTTEMEIPESMLPRVRESTIAILVLEVLKYTGSCQESGGGDPMPLKQLGAIAETEDGWCAVMLGLVNTMPLFEPLVPSAMVAIFDYCPNPSRDMILGFVLSMNLGTARVKESYLSQDALRRERNLLFLFTCLVDKYATHSSVDMLTCDMLEYLLTYLMDGECVELVLLAVVTLEKLAATAQNKVKIEKILRKCFLHPLLPLEDPREPTDYPRRCIAFAATYALDNIFIFSGRKFSFEVAETENINVMLNTKDKTNYLKISGNGLEARNDALSFESVRSTFQIKKGVYYYEVEVVTAGVMQIGFATKNTEFENHDGFGIGDDEDSIAYDGCRRLLWYKARAIRVRDPRVERWRAGDVLGCLADTARCEIVFSVNGFELPPYSPEFMTTGTFFYAAASFMVSQQCVFNFGATPFKYPPRDRAYEIMNNQGTLTAKQKLVLPRAVEAEMMLAEKKTNGSGGDICAVCYQDEVGFGLEPCRHNGFCPLCIMKLVECPLCRTDVQSVYMYP